MSSKPSTPITKDKKKKHTAVIYFHGMGSQKRYEEVSRLVDALDRFDYESHNRGFRGIKATSETPTTDLGREVGFIDSVYIDHSSKNPQRPHFRFYEAYWANLTAGGVPTKDVLLWILQQFFIPIKYLIAPWRAMQRLKRGVLMENWDKLRTQRPDINDNDLKHLLEKYDDFERWEARRKYPKGSLGQFVDLLSNGTEEASRVERLIWITRKWRSRFIISNLLSFLTIFTFLLAAALVVLGLFAIISFILQAVTPVTPTLVTNLLGEDALDPTISANILLAVGAVFTALGVPYFLREYMGDVIFWTTYEETAEKHQKRRAILNHCANILEHVLRTDCDRVIVVAHSLGSTIAFDTILELERRKSALESAGTPNANLLPLEKIQHLITMGSPIDKIHYFFESQSSKYHRYNRVVEEIRGDISKSPFLQAKKPHIHWINFWDKADIISGSLQTPEGRIEPSVRVDNYEVASFHFPFPGEAHLAYFENREVIETIYHSIFHNDYNLYTVSAQKGKKDYLAQRTGPGKGINLTQPVQALVLFLPWLITTYLAVRSLEIMSVEPLLRFINYGIAALIVLWGVIGKIKGQINRLIPTSVRQVDK